ncbi:MAG TPA: DUF3016 domain-containing protein [Rhodanobacteraceae bacterium]
MKLARSHTLCALAFAIAAGPVAVSAAPKPDSDSRVQVSWTKPSDFSEAKESTGTGLGRQSPDEWLDDLANHLRYRAERILPQDERLTVTFTNVQLAGSYEPWRGPRWDDVRIVKDIYSPRIDLTFTLTGAGGTVVKEGDRKLRDPSFMQRGILNQNDPLRYEKRMLDDWLRSEFPDAGDQRG